MNQKAQNSAGKAVIAVQDARNPTLVALGERVRALRTRHGLTRKAAALAADISERHFANLEYGIGNASILVLQQVADALRCPLAELIGDVTTRSPEWMMIRHMLEGRTEADLRRVRLTLSQQFGAVDKDGRRGRIALIGLRGAGKSTLGRMLADRNEVPFIELSREIEKLAGCSIREIHDLYGPPAYRRYERRAIEAVVGAQSGVVIAAPGGIVSDPVTFNLLLAHCTTIWLRADAEDHMQRVVEQGDTRPMAASREAMADLRRILAGRASFYSKADLSLDTSRQGLEETFQALCRLTGPIVGTVL